MCSEAALPASRRQPCSLGHTTSSGGRDGWPGRAEPAPKTLQGGRLLPVYLAQELCEAGILKFIYKHWQLARRGGQPGSTPDQRWGGHLNLGPPTLNLPLPSPHSDKGINGGVEGRWHIFSLKRGEKGLASVYFRTAWSPGLSARGPIPSALLLPQTAQVQ